MHSASQRFLRVDVVPVDVGFVLLYVELLLKWGYIAKPTIFFMISVDCTTLHW